MGLSDALQRRVRPHKEGEEAERYNRSSGSSDAESAGRSDSSEVDSSRGEESQSESTV